MPCWAVTGKTGQGKGLVSAGLIVDYLKQGKIVATNMDINPEEYPNLRNDKHRIIRLPDYPTAEDLIAIGYGADESVYDEDDFGLLMLDEGATWLNSRDWNAPGRKEFNDWFVQRRKYKWNVAIQIQSLESMDAQARRQVISHEMRAVKIEAIYIPVITFIIKEITGTRLPKLPKFMRYHKAKMTNIETTGVEDITRYTGKSLHGYYNTLQVFNEDCGHGPYCYLTPWHLKGRYLPPKITIKQWLMMPVKVVCWLLLSLHSDGKRFLPNKNIDTRASILIPEHR